MFKENEGPCGHAADYGCTGTSGETLEIARVDNDVVITYSEYGCWDPRQPNRVWAETISVSRFRDTLGAWLNQDSPSWPIREGFELDEEDLLHLLGSLS